MDQQQSQNQSQGQNQIPKDSPADDPALQGEGNYTAARRHREAEEAFVAAGRVEPAARDAAPKDQAEADAMAEAEAAGRAHAKP